MIKDTIIAPSGKGFPLSVTKRIIDEAFDLYMPQVRSEITQLTNFIKWEHSLNKENYTILEIGTKFGGTFYIWNSINSNGKNISIDMTDGGLHGGISEEEMDKRDLWFKERFNNCHFVRGNSHDIVTKKKVGMFSKLNGDTFNIIPFIDFLFIDGDHTFEGVKTDFEMYSPLVKQGGCIAFHDITISNHHHLRNVYVGEFWKEITKNKIQSRYGFNICDIYGTAYEFFEIIGSKDQDWAGIGILIKQ